jgi:hypothetical protein
MGLRRVSLWIQKGAGRLTLDIRPLHFGHAELSRAPAVIDPFQFKVVAKLASLKLYPQTRAVPRQALKEYLLKLPLKRGVVNFSHRLTSVSYRTSATGQTEVVCQFDNGKTIVADVRNFHTHSRWFFVSQAESESS